MAFVPKYILILFFLITVDYFLAQAINKEEGKKRKIFLVLSLLANLGILFVFKYFNFFNTNVSAIANFFHWNYSLMLIKIALPLGLSFHIFQSLSYVIEVYRGKYKPETNYLKYALYVMFFPQLVAGPIERPQHLLPQFKLEHKFDSFKVRRGLERMLWGFFKKLVIADSVAVMVNHIYANVPTEGPILIVVMVLFTYQIYCDFSGYSDIAIGSALVLGYDLTENFNRPFVAKSIADFWRRWHISLSSWLRDYLYYPLALGRGKITKTKLYSSMFVTFVLIGLWHGANWTFVVFGAIHGFYLVFSSLTEKIRTKLAEIIGLLKFPKIYHGLQIFTVFCLVSLANVFFRAIDLHQAWGIIANLGNNWQKIFNLNYLRYQLLTEKGIGATKNTLLIIVLAILFMEVIQRYQDKNNNFYIFDTKPKLVKYLWYYLLIFLILFFGYSGQDNQAFIYFQF
jgi:D-alanyl-lipoteichoic acid acyltransferase DltB (MBOAT superfamily)